MMWLINIHRVGFDSSVEINEVNLSLYYGGVYTHSSAVTNSVK